MRLILTLCLVIPALAAAASAQSQSKPRRRLPPPPAAAQTLLTTPAAPAASISRPARPISASAFDAGPTCRAQCSKDRYSCHGEDDATDCDGRWLTCLSACSAR